MSLHEVLSAVREMILDELPLPERAAQRSDALRRRFKTLTDREREDLAAIPPDRLRVYTELVYAGLRSTLLWVFPMSMAAAVRWARRDGDQRPTSEIELDLVRDMQRRTPWRSSSTRALAACFQTYIAKHRQDLLKGWGGLCDLIDYERTDLDVFYAEDVAAEALRVEDLTQWSVGRLMEQIVVRPVYAMHRRFRYDVLALAAHWREHKSLPDSLPGPAACPCACGRAPENLSPRWVRLSDGACAALDQLTPGDEILLNDVANAYLKSCGDGAPQKQEEAFGAFFRQLADWASAGVLLRPVSQTSPNVRTA